MSKVPSLDYTKLVKALQRDGWVTVRQKGSHIRMQKHLKNEVLKITIPAHKPIKRSTLSQILKQAKIKVEKLRQLL